ncbi:MAG TPA: HAMP domain-containing sensor histidine kinase [Gemmatimonadales bacterium]|nr:HAMP domain-containing sensor histidine kinase [Gemmatimonadales bacterium]
MADRRARQLAPWLAVVLVALLAGFSLGTALVVARHLREDAVALSRLYSGVFDGLNTPGEGAELQALLGLAEEVKGTGIPLVLTDGTGRVAAAANLPFEAELDDPRVLDYARQLDRQNPPLVNELGGTVHFGPVPFRDQLVLLAVLQVATLICMVLVGRYAYRSAMTAQRDRLWVAMAREAAHQMGTPLTSLEGWIEQVRSRPSPPAGLAEHLSADAERLDRVAQRFERIGNEAKREPVGLGAVADRVAGYFRPRLPRHANPIRLTVEAAGSGPVVLGDPVLLEWAMEALVKNAIDALQGRAGAITIEVGTQGSHGVIRVRDDGPGVAGEVRRKLFEPGVTTKSRGWGIGLALTQRVVEDAHGGNLTLEPTETGASFLIELPLSEA